MKGSVANRVELFAIVIPNRFREKPRNYVKQRMPAADEGVWDITEIREAQPGLWFARDGALVGSDKKKFPPRRDAQVEQLYTFNAYAPFRMPVSRHNESSNSF